jgi:hypothetical protein
LRREVILAAVLASIAGNSVFASEAPKATGPLLGDKSDGSRAHPVHRIPLFAENDAGGKGPQVDANAPVVLPFSTKWTCGECHSYDIIRKGWHFNATDPCVPAGRPGEPWVYFSPRLGLQIPLSYRSWSGVHRPDEIGMSEYQFTQTFGRHMPGGGSGEVPPKSVDDRGRQLVSGKLEVNCLACHNKNPGQDMGGVAGYAVQVSRQNFRWAAAASCEFATMKGSAADMPVTYDPFMPEGKPKEPQIGYRKDAFDTDGKVLFSIDREASKDRCYFCHTDVYHSEANAPAEKWTSEEDVHLKAGLTCVDCHRNGLQHDIVRGYPGESDVSKNKMAAVTTCESCHLPHGSGVPVAGRMTAPVPKHVGLPPVHFEKLTCTACHSGPWPSGRTVATKTSRAHLLGVPNSSKERDVLPHIVSPVFAKQGDKIGPNRMIWPAFWATMTDSNVVPIKLETLENTVKETFKDVNLPANGSWPSLTKERIAAALKALAPAVKSKPVYIAGGSLYRLNDAGEVVEQPDHPAAAPYMWPIAHTVRPAAQSLGVRYCTDCHSTDSPFFFGSVTVDGPVSGTKPAVRRMVDYQKIDPTYAWVFAASFVFRPWFKVMVGGAAAVLAVVLLLYGLRALGAAAKALSEDE